jgi:hypothetical protein
MVSARRQASSTFGGESFALTSGGTAAGCTDDTSAPDRPSRIDDVRPLVDATPL